MSNEAQQELQDALHGERPASSRPSPWETADGHPLGANSDPRALASGQDEAAAGWAARTLARLDRLSAHGRVEAMLSDPLTQSGTRCAPARSFAGSAWTNTTYLEPTLTMLKHYLETGIEVACDYDPSLPRVPAYAGELNQAGPTPIDNGVDA